MRLDLLERQVTTAGELKRSGNQTAKQIMIPKVQEIPEVMNFSFQITTLK